MLLGCRDETGRNAPVMIVLGAKALGGRPFTGPAAAAGQGL